MKRKIHMKGLLILVLLIVFTTQQNALASDRGKRQTGTEHTAIVLATFGSTVPSALPAITNIMEKIQTAYPGIELRITLTSNIIRSVWKKRQQDAGKWLDMGVPKEILYAKNIISVIGDLKEDGYSTIIVAPSHMFFMEQSQDLQAYVNALASIATTKEKWNPFDKLVMARPALGMPGDRYNYHADIEAAVKTLAKDAALAQEKNAMLVYMGHGNKLWSTGIYNETQKQLRQTYPGVMSYVGVAEGYPNLDDILPGLSHAKTKNIILKPFMIVAGNHANTDMAGDDADSWVSRLTKAGYNVTPILEGLGANDEFAEIFVDHIRNTAQEHGIVLQ